MKSSINKFVVVLDEPSHVFSPGDSVDGKVVLDVKQEIKLWKLNLECRGEVYVSWPEYNGTYTRYRFGREELFHVKTCVHGAKTIEDKIKSKKSSPSVLKPSVYSFSFRYTIPCIDLPPSYEAKHGYIRYWIQANIEKKKGTSELKTAQEVFDIGGYNEYDDEELTEIKDYELNFPNARKTTTGGSCYSAKSITLSARTNKSLYHPGEVIKTAVTTDNEVYRGGTVQGIEVSLVRVTVYDDGKNNKTNSNQEVVRAEKEIEDVQEEDLELVLPANSLYQTMLRGCKNIKVTYYIQVRLKINGKFQKEPVLMIPVAIVPSPIQPSLITPTHSHSDLQKDNARSNSVSNITPGTLFYVTGSPYGNKWHISAGPLYEQHQPRRAPRVGPLDDDTSGDFYLNDRPSISYV